MDVILLFAANEAMAFLTCIIAFPGLLPPKDGMEWFMVGLMFLILSGVWWIYLAVAPFAFLVLYLLGDWKLRDYLDEWPWKQLFRSR